MRENFLFSSLLMLFLLLCQAKKTPEISPLELRDSRLTSILPFEYQRTLTFESPKSVNIHPEDEESRPKVEDLDKSRSLREYSKLIEFVLSAKKFAVLPS